MILRDLVIKHEHGKIEFYCEVIIKRDGKHYSVPVRVQSNRNDLIETIEYALEKCEAIDRSWVITGEEPKEGELNFSGVVITATEIEL